MRIAAGLRAILLDRIAGEFAAAGPKLGWPANHGDGQQRLRAAVLAVGHEIVRRRRRRGRAVIDALEIPIRAMIMRVKLPVIPRLRIASRPIHSEIPIRQLVRGGEGDAIDEGADRVPVQLRIHRDGDGSVSHRWSAARNQLDVVQVKGRLRTPGQILQREPGKSRLVGNPQRSE